MNKIHFGWGKAVGMLFAVVIPAGLVAYCNHVVFPESSYIAIGMVVVSVGIAGIFAVASGYAMPAVRRYCLFAHLALCLVLSANLAAHWVLSRQVSGARQATNERHTEEDRVEARRQAQAADQLKLMHASTQQMKMEAIRNDSARRLGITAPRGGTVSAAAVAPSAGTTSALPAASISVEQVMAKWGDWLMWFAIADLLTSVVAFGICGLMWEWDRNGNGIPNHLEQPVRWPVEVGK